MAAELSRAARARRTIERVLYLTLATSGKDGQAWCTPVFTAFNGAYEFFWGSARTARHSCNIRENPQVGAVLYDSLTPESVTSAEDDIKALYIKGVAEELPPDLRAEAANILRARSSLPETFWPQGIENSSLGLYRLKPVEFSILIEGGDPDAEIYADKREIIDIFGS